MSDPLLERMQQQVADRTPIDWPLVEREPLSTEAAAELRLLQLLDEVAAAHSSFQDGSSTVPEERLRPAAGEETLTAWGRYRLDEKIGRGGFGDVYRGWDPELEMPVAIKILHRRVDDDRLKTRLLREGRLLAQIRHPNVVRVLTIEESAGRLGLVMEFVRGETLHERVVAHGPLSDREAAMIGDDVCQALAVVHAAGLIHRDVKARNIMREHAGRIVLMDFGTGLRGGTDHGDAAGTPLYMAPETLDGAAASEASDVYSVGVLLYFLTTGRHPFEGSSVDEIRARQRQGRRRTLLELRPDVSPLFAKAVEGALALDPRERFGSVTALREALARLLERVNRVRQLLGRGALAVVGLIIFLTFGGFISSRAFNVTLGRGRFATESFVDWLVLGAESLVLPAVQTALTIAVISLLIALRRLLLAASPPLANLDRRLGTWLGTLWHRLSIGDCTVGSCWLLVLSAAGLATIWAFWSPLLAAVTANAAEDPPQVLAWLSPAHGSHRASYRMALTLLAAGNLVAWYGIHRSARRQGASVPLWATAAQISLLFVLLGSLQLPYRLINRATFPMVSWREVKCYVIGAQADERLLFCPPLKSRNRVVPAETSELRPSTCEENVFTDFASREGARPAVMPDDAECQPKSERKL